MRSEMVSTWVDTSLIGRLHDLRRTRPHCPTLTGVAALAIQEGLETLAAGTPAQLKLGAAAGGHRRAFTFRLPVRLYRRVLAASQEMPDAANPSAALHLVLWLGLNRLLESAEAGRAA
jgi:hypothetical protein